MGLGSPLFLRSRTSSLSPYPYSISRSIHLESAIDAYLIFQFDQYFLPKSHREDSMSQLEVVKTFHLLDRQQTLSYSNGGPSTK